MDKEKDAITRIQRGLKCSYEEAREVYMSDIAIDHNEKQDFDLPPEKLKDARKFAHTGTRKAPTAYKFTKRERKPNATKGGIIQALFDYFSSENCGFDVKNTTILNKERQISFQIGDETYELTLVQKRKAKK